MIRHTVCPTSLWSHFWVTIHHCEAWWWFNPPVLYHVTPTLCSLYRMTTGARLPPWSLAPLWTASPTRTWRGSLRNLRSPRRWSAAVTSAQPWVLSLASSPSSLPWPSWPSHSSCGGIHWNLAVHHARAFTFLWPSSSWSSSSPPGRCFSAHPEPLCRASSSSAVCCWRWSSSLWHLIGSSTGCGCWSPGRRTTGGLWDTQHLWWTHCCSFSTWRWCCWRSDICSLLSVWRWWGPQMGRVSSTTWVVSGQPII